MGKENIRSEDEKFNTQRMNPLIFDF